MDEEEEEEEEKGPPNMEDEKVLDQLTIKVAFPYTEHFQQVEQKACINISKLSSHIQQQHPEDLSLQSK